MSVEKTMKKYRSLVRSLAAVTLIDQQDVQEAVFLGGNKRAVEEKPERQALKTIRIRGLLSWRWLKLSVDGSEGAEDYGRSTGTITLSQKIVLFSLKPPMTRRLSSVFRATRSTMPRKDSSSG